MTNKEQATVDFIRAYTADNGYSPNFAEIMEAIGEKSKAGMTRILNRLTDKGMIKRSAGVARSIRVVDFSH